MLDLIGSRFRPAGRASTIASGRASQAFLAEVVQAPAVLVGNFAQAACARSARAVSLSRWVRARCAPPCLTPPCWVAVPTAAGPPWRDGCKRLIVYSCSLPAVAADCWSADRPHFPCRISASNPLYATALIAEQAMRQLIAAPARPPSRLLGAAGHGASAWRCGHGRPTAAALLARIAAPCCALGRGRPAVAE